MKRLKQTLGMAVFAGLALVSSAQAGDGFDVLALGARGGIEDGNLSAVKEPQLKKYELTALVPGERRELAGTAMTVTAYPLSHGGVESTAFLIESGEDALLCFGDTGPDEVEKSTNMHDIWVAVSERVKQKQLKAIIIETSYTNAQPGKQLFGHLTPAI